MSEEEDSVAQGWDAIDAALRPVYGDLEPKHYGPVIKAMLGGPDPLDGISAYRRTDGVPHWHFVTYGLTELYTKEADDPEVSGYGFELTFRLACHVDEQDPPLWAMNFLQNLARYVFRSGNVFAPGHHMTLNGPIALGRDTDIGAVIFVADPELPPAASPHGPIDFVQVVGITPDELEAVQAWKTSSFAELLGSISPLLVTDLARKSMLADAETSRLVAARMSREGSSTSELYLTTVSWSRAGLVGKRTRLTLDALGVQSLIRQLRGRLVHRRRLLVIGKGGKSENVASFRPADDSSVSVGEEGVLQIDVPPAVAIEISETLHPHRGIYRWSPLPGLEIEVIPTEIKDSEGRIIRVVG
jgi:hypothetical protein